MTTTTTTWAFLKSAKKKVIDCIDAQYSVVVKCYARRDDVTIGLPPITEVRLPEPLPDKYRHAIYSPCTIDAHTAGMNMHYADFELMTYKTRSGAPRRCYILKEVATK